MTRLEQVPVPGPGSDATLTVLDAGWPLTDLLTAADAGHWAGGALRAGPVVLTARASLPGLRSAETAVEALRGCAGSVSLLLVGARRVPNWVRACAGPAVTRLQGAGRVVSAPECAQLARAGLTPAPLPRALTEVGTRLAQLTSPPPSPGVRGAIGPPGQPEQGPDTTIRKGRDVL